MDIETKDTIKLLVAIAGTAAALYAGKRWIKHVADKRWESQKEAMLRTRTAK